MNSKSKAIVPSWVVFVAAAFCFVAVADLPYGFYVLLRWIVCATATALAFDFFRLRIIGWVWGIGILAVLFNPLVPIHFNRETWRILDVLAGIILLISGRVASTKRPQG